MKLIASLLQLLGLGVIAAAVTVWSPIVGAVLAGVFVFAVGLAVER